METEALLVGLGKAAVRPPGVEVEAAGSRETGRLCFQSAASWAGASVPSEMGGRGREGRGGRCNACLPRAVSRAREAVLDAHFLVLASDLGKEKARQLRSDLSSFDALRYVETLVSSERRSLKAPSPGGLLCRVRRQQPPPTVPSWGLSLWRETHPVRRVAGGRGGRRSSEQLDSQLPRRRAVDGRAVDGWTDGRAVSSSR